MSKIDPEEIQKRMARISEMFSEMVSHAEIVSQTRCPYRDRHDFCSAEFRCRNQKPPTSEGERHPCGHEGDFDYRSAWESDPRAADTARQRIKRQRRRLKADLPPPS